MKRSILATVTGLLLLACANIPATAAVRLPHVFGDNMVLQRDRPVPVWGWADPREKVTVEFAGQRATAAADANGAWMVRLKPLAVSEAPRGMTVRGANTIVFNNVVVGDVWLCSGDLGASYKTYACADAANELAAANHPSLRLLRVATKTSNTSLLDIGGAWQPCSPQTVPDFSGLGYFFARDLQQELKVPIGIIDCTYNYSYVRTWIAPAGIRLIPELKKPRERLDSWDSTTATGQQAFGNAIVQIEQWLPLAQKALDDAKPLPPQPLLPAPITARDENFNSIGELSVAYHGMVAPLVPFALRGVIWSQGENGSESDLMQAWLEGLSGGWRKMWGQGDFPFYYELLARVGKPGAGPSAHDSWTQAREGQIKAQSIPNSGMVVSYDVSDYDSDNRDRQDAGHRFALWALANEYHEKVECSGPLYRGHHIEGDKVTIAFDHVGAGLMVGAKDGLAPTREVKDGALQKFALAGADKQWFWAEGHIAGDTVVLQSDKVAAPVAARYAWSANPLGANLYNRDGLPAAPFRTDDW